MVASRVLLFLATFVAWPALVKAGVPITGYTDTRVADGLTLPTAVAFLPDGRLLITEQTGALKLHVGGATTTLATLPVCSVNELGLLGVAVDPDVSSTGYVYLFQSESAGGCGPGPGRTNQVVRVTMANDAVDLASLVVILPGIPVSVEANHNGGCLRFGADGMLYVSVGDGGVGDNVGCPGTSTNTTAQGLGRLEGKILRINRDGSVPSGNPFTTPNRPEIFAYGFRNPFRFGFDPQTNQLWVGDVGDEAFEEINLVLSGQNYGWPQCEGTNHPAGCAQNGEVDPIYFYSHGGTCPGESTAPPSLGGAIVGGSFVGASFGPAFAPYDYVFSDYLGTALYRAAVNPQRTGIVGNPTPVVTLAGQPVDVITGPDGFVYYVAYADNEVRQFRPSSSGTTASTTTATTTLTTTSTTTGTTGSSTSVTTTTGTTGSSTSVTTTTGTTGSSTSVTTTTTGAPTSTSTTSTSTSASTATASTTTTVPEPFCRASVAFRTARLVFSPGSPAPGDERFVAQGVLQFPSGNSAPLDPAADGMQLLLVDPPTQGALYELSSRTEVIPGTAACSARDRWRRLDYRNRSGALPPSCLPGTARGLKHVRFGTRRASGTVKMALQVAGATIPNPGTSVELLVVLAADPRATVDGRCARVTFTTCAARGRKIVCTRGASAPQR